MHTLVDPRLTEESVFLALLKNAPDPRAELARYHRLADEIYKISDSELREMEFQKLHRDVFSRLRLNEHIESAADYFPDLKIRLARLVLVYSERRKDEDAELFHHVVDGWSLVFRVRAETLIDPRAFRRIALHEMSHASDMLSPEFGYVRSTGDTQHNAQQRDMVRDRFRCLWDICIDGRLNRENEQPLQRREGHELNFLRHFGVSKLTQTLFFRLWAVQVPAKPTGMSLMMAAGAPEALCALAGVEVAVPAQMADIRSFTAMCPLCQCPTTDWVRDNTLIPNDVILSIHAKFPDWTSSEPICRQCEEMFQASLSVVP